MTDSAIPSVSNVQTYSHAASHSQVQTQIQDDRNEKTEKQIQDINNQVAQFRDLLINIGQPRDCPELREKIRRLRRNCVEACKNTSQLILPQVRSVNKTLNLLISGSEIGRQAGKKLKRQKQGETEND
ncbi:hypothetical protein K0M31_017463 [Melipona bicolor]|uniref:Syntaxin N-terminal domain-containing protein n=1 Tax=Melipona bicolor TaxID=60889 RepID=A0AA40KSG6_9HYME|nr:hypothetical protein K0M31_017463 [Melipona bicolor]